PAAFNAEETSNTLKFAERVKRVPVRAHQNQVLDEKALIQKYKLEIAELRNKLVETNDLLEKERALQDGNLERTIRQQYEEQLHESQLVRTALKERIDHLTKLILSSNSVTPKAILDWNAPVETGVNNLFLSNSRTDEYISQDKRASVIVDGLLPQSATATVEQSRMSRIGRKNMRLSRQLSDKDFVRKQIAEIDKRDEQINRLESLVSMLKSSKDREVQVAIANFSNDADKAIQSTEELKEELHRLRKQNEEMDIVIAEQNEKLELLESGKGAANNASAPGASFEDTPRYQEMSLLLSQQRQTLEDRDSLVRALKTQIQELRSQVRQLELNEFEHLEQLAAAGISKRDSIVSKRSSLTSESVAARVRELEATLDRERRLREEEQTKAASTIGNLESELTMLKVELDVANRIFTTRYEG
ncbi:NADH-ubiquinone oxidoreductase chain 1, partial [Cladochytrium tenue]